MGFPFISVRETSSIPFFFKKKNLEEGRARLGLNCEQKSEADHGSTSVQHLSLRREEGKLLLLDSLKNRDQRSGGKHDESKQDRWLSVANLLEDSFPRGGLGTQSSNETKHGQASVNGLRTRTRESHGLTEGHLLLAGGG